MTALAIPERTPLTPAERTRLAELEAVIERGQETFIEVGSALTEIRDTRLYLETHATFEAYCQERWGWSRRHANRTIQAAEVAEILGPMGPANERQARELVPLLHDEQAMLEVIRDLRDEFGEDQVTAQRIRTTVRNRIRTAERQRHAHPVVHDFEPSLPADIDLRQGDFRDVLADVRDVDLVFTDPPYPREYLPLYSDLGEWAAQALKPGRPLIAYCGHDYYEEVFDRLREHLTFHWPLSVHLVGRRNDDEGEERYTRGHHGVSHNFRMVIYSKPLLMFTRGEYQPLRLCPDSIIAYDTREGLHEWEQNRGAAEHFISYLTDPRRPGREPDLVADPFLGAGTFAVVAQELGRRFVGADSDPRAFEIARSRFGAQS